VFRLSVLVQYDEISETRGGNRWRVSTEVTALYESKVSGQKGHLKDSGFTPMTESRVGGRSIRNARRTTVADRKRTDLAAEVG
jgi:hypothetical protein